MNVSRMPVLRVVAPLLAVFLLAAACGSEDTPTANPSTTTARDWCTVALDLEAQGEALDPFELSDVEYNKQTALLNESFLDEMILAAPDDLDVDIQAMADEAREFNSAMADAGWDIEAVPEEVLEAFFANFDDGIVIEEYNAANCGTLAGSDSFETPTSAPAAGAPGTTAPATTVPAATVAPTTAAESADPPSFTSDEIDDLLADPAGRLELLAPYFEEGMTETEAECVVRGVLGLPNSASDDDLLGTYTDCGV